MDKASLRKKKDREVRKKDIIEAAEELFFRIGYENTRIDDIAKKAEFSKRTVYVYFKNKREIYLEIIIRAFRKFEKQNLEFSKTENSLNGMEKLKIKMDAAFDFYVKYPDHTDLIISYETRESDFTDCAEVTGRLHKEGDRYFIELREIIQEGMDDGSIRNDIDKMNTVLMIWGNLIGIATLITKKSRYLKRYHHKDIKEITEQTRNYIVRSIRANNNLAEPEE